MVLKKFAGAPVGKDGFPDFHPYALSAGLDDVTFPYARMGLRVFGYGRYWFGWLLRVGVPALLLHLFVGFSDRFAALLAGSFAEGLLPHLVFGASWLVGYLDMALWSFLVPLVTLLWCLYWLIGFARWRSFERNVFSSDYRSYHLKRRLVEALRIARQVSDQQETNRKEKENSDNSKVSLDNLDKLAALKSFSKIELYVNVRQSLDDDRLLRYYYVVIPMPDSTGAREHLRQLASDVGKTTNRLDKSELRFGDFLESDDTTIVYFQDAYEIENKYKREVVVEQQEAKSVFSFPLALFVNRESEIAAVKLSATRWAEQQARVLDNFFNTKKLVSRRLDLTVAATTVTVTYERSLDMSNVGNIDSMSSAIDTFFNLVGTNIILEGNRVFVTLPLPAGKTLPIDVPTMFRQVFGSDV